MRKKMFVMLALALTAGVIVGLVAGPATSQVDPQRTTITLFDPQATQHEKEIDEKPAGFSAGDWGVFREKQLDPETCETAGQVVGRFTFVESIGKDNGYFMVDGGLLLDDGKLTFQGTGKFSEDTAFNIAVTGGTGPYKDASGEVTFADNATNCDKKGDLITIDLLLTH